MQGYLVLFDLSGYTEFLVGSDLERAPGILHTLIGTTVQHVDAGLEIAEIEGDAIFAFAPDVAFPDGRALLAAIERVYCAFAAAREQMERNVACDCAGCRLVARLDLKVVAHRGSFALGSLVAGTRAKPMGADVILVHRLLKNHIVERTGVEAYAFLTDACMRGAGSDTPGNDAIRHEETYAHLGSVSGSVHDLETVWAEEREKRLVRVAPADAWIETAIEIDAPVETVWQAACSPAFRSLWRLSRPFDPAAMTGRVEEYCFAGEIVGTDRVMDWQPFHRLTLECEGPDALQLRVTTELNATSEGTRVTSRIGTPTPEPESRMRDEITRRARLTLTVLDRWLVRASPAPGRGLPVVSPDAPASPRDS